MQEVPLRPRRGRSGLFAARGYEDLPPSWRDRRAHAPLARVRLRPWAAGRAAVHPCFPPDLRHVPHTSGHRCRHQPGQMSPVAHDPRLELSEVLDHRAQKPLRWCSSARTRRDVLKTVAAKVASGRRREPCQLHALHLEPRRRGQGRARRSYFAGPSCGQVER